MRVGILVPLNNQLEVYWGQSLPHALPQNVLQFIDKVEENDSPIIFSEWLKGRRKALDMTQDELAKRAGCSVFALRKIEG